MGCKSCRLRRVGDKEFNGDYGKMNSTEKCKSELPSSQISIPYVSPSGSYLLPKIQMLHQIMPNPQTPMLCQSKTHIIPRGFVQSYPAFPILDPSQVKWCKNNPKRHIRCSYSKTPLMKSSIKKEPQLPHLRTP